MTCDLDPVNMCCWTHGCDIDESDYIEGVCSMGSEEDSEYFSEGDDYDSEDYEYYEPQGDQK